MAMGGSTSTYKEQTQQSHYYNNTLKIDILGLLLKSSKLNSGCMSEKYDAF